MQLAVSWLALLALAVMGCQGSSAPAGPTSGQAIKGDGVLAAEALERGDYAMAVELYPRALAAAPESLALHYGLGVAASFLDRRALAVRELIWVLEHGEAGSNEVNAARRWLLSVGALPRPSTAEASTLSPEEEPRVEQVAARPGSVHGRSMSGDSPGSLAPMVRMQLILKSTNDYFRLRTDEHGYFRFANVPPGIYQLTERVAGPPTWRLRVEVKPGQDVALDLGPENSTRIRDDFPDLTPPLGARTR
jgi:hypothetical protein